MFNANSVRMKKRALWLKYGIGKKNHLNLSLCLEKDLLWDISLHCASVSFVFKRDTPVVSHAENKVVNGLPGALKS